MNRKNMPLLLMLIAGACTWIVTLVRSYSLLASLVALFTVMLLFYCLGSVIRLLLDRFDRQNEEKAKQEQEGFTRGRSCWVTRGHSAEGCKRFEWMKPVRKGY